MKQAAAAMTTDDLPGTAMQAAADERLMAAVAKGDRMAFETLARRHLRRVFNLARSLVSQRADAEDVAQEVFTRLWIYAPRWREGEAAFTTWLHRITVNCCTDHLKRRGAAKTAEMPESLAAAGDPEQDFALAQKKARLRAALGKLPERQRLAVTLCYLAEMTNAEAAAAMDVHIKALEGLLGRARKALRGFLEETQ